MATMLYQGHGSYRFALEDGTTIYVDPFVGEGYDRPADIILVSHEHFDHTQVDKMPHALGCTIIRAADIHPAPDAYLTIPTHGVLITAVQAYNKNHAADACVGFIIEMDGMTFYASGDTSTTEDMTSGKLSAMGIDYAAFCCDGVYNMDTAEASICAKLVGARHSIPVHVIPTGGKAEQPIFDRATAEKFKVPGRIILEPGEELELV